jgi:tetratricopeptide (TPR) repeat protein
VFTGNSPASWEEFFPWSEENKLHFLCVARAIAENDRDFGKVLDLLILWYIYCICFGVFMKDSRKEMLQPKEALETIKHAHLIPPDDARGYFHLGIAYAKLDCWQNAIAAFEQAIRIQPNYADAHCHLGLLYLACQDREAAWHEYRILRKLDPVTATQLLRHLWNFCTMKREGVS